MDRDNPVGGGEGTLSDGDVCASPALGRALDLLRRAARGDAHTLLGAAAEIVRVLTGGGRARAILPGDAEDPGAHVAGSDDTTGPIVLAAREGTVSLSLPLWTHEGTVGAVVVQEIPRERATPADLDT